MTMAPAALDSAEAQWQTQFAAMRAALAELKLPTTNVDTLSSYGSDFNFSDEDFTSGNSGDDVWDFISSSEDELWSSDAHDSFTPSSGLEISDFNPAWLKSKCENLAIRKQGFSASNLQEQIMAILASDSGEEELQSTLTDIIGFDDLDLVIELISHRKEVLSLREKEVRKGQTEGLFEGKLQTRKQREEALRKADFEHKNAVLGQAVNRDETMYPHVYKAHSAGNTLDSRGKKYALPAGSERTEHLVR
jgi:antiviral helicase SLH1